jgi:hypothetical protein
MKITAMAMSRSQFEAKLNEFLNGGFGEYFLARLAETLGWPKTYVNKWDREAERIVLKELSRFFFNQETKSNFGEGLLYKCLSEIKEKDMKWLAYGTGYLVKVARNKNLPAKFRKMDYDFEKWFSDFSAMVEVAISGE